MPALATEEDYELVIGPVPDEELPRLDMMLDVASGVVVSVAPKLYPWFVTPLDEDGQPIDQGPVPPPAVLVTCQVASNLMAQPAGAPGPVVMERIGLAQTHYATDWTVASGLLPGGWQLILQPWRCPDLASILLVVPHPAPGFWWNQWWVVEDPADEVVP